MKNVYCSEEHKTQNIVNCEECAVKFVEALIVEGVCDGTYTQLDLITDIEDGKPNNLTFELIKNTADKFRYGGFENNYCYLNQEYNYFETDKDIPYIEPIYGDTEYTVQSVLEKITEADNQIPAMQVFDKALTALIDETVSTGDLSFAQMIRKINEKEFGLLILNGDVLGKR